MVNLLLADQAASSRWESFHSGGLHCHFRSDVGDAVVTAYESHAWVYDAIRRQSGAVLFRGRRPVVGGQLGSLPVVVKRLVHGGLLAKIAGDRFLTPDRLQAHAPLSNFLARHEISTAPVVFTAWRRVAGLVRCEIGFELIEDAIDGDRYFFGSAKPPLGWESRAADLGALVARLHSIGFLHADLNLMNVVFRGDGEICLIDLDKSVVQPAGLTPQRCQRNLERLERSIRKQGRHHLPALVEWIIQKVRASYHRALIATNALLVPQLIRAAGEMPIA